MSNPSRQWEPRPEPIRGDCNLTILEPPETGIRGLFRRGEVEYDFGIDRDRWNIAAHTAAYILDKAVQVDGPAGRTFPDLMVTIGGQLAVAGNASGWRVAQTKLAREFVIPDNRLITVGEEKVSPAYWSQLRAPFPILGGGVARLISPSIVAGTFEYLRDTTQK